MKPVLANPKTLSDWIGWLSVGSVILVASIAFQQPPDIPVGDRCELTWSFEPVAQDYAHSITVQHYVATNSTRSQWKRTRSLVSTRSSWYRYALPISTAVFLLSFSLWSLQSLPNDAIQS